MYEKETADIFRKRGLKCGTCAYMTSAYEPDGTFKTVVVTLLPYYFKPEKPHNISLYAMLPDYHSVLSDILNGICGELKALMPGCRFEPHVDISPVKEKKAASLAGLGFIGKNTLLISEEYGSFVFIGDICTDADINIPSVPVKSRCGNCDMCVKSCPAGALNFGFDKSKCLSAVTQKRGELSDKEALLIRKTGCVWGCDVCSLVCPCNAEIPESRLAADNKDNLICHITYEMLDGLSDREFRRKFGDRAFIWRGVSTLRRNLKAAEADIE